MMMHRWRRSREFIRSACKSLSSLRQKNTTQCLLLFQKPEEEEGDVSEGGGGGDFPEPPEEAKLFVGNLAYDVESQALAMLFEQAGYIQQGNQPESWVWFCDNETAVEKFNRYDLNGRLLTVNKAAPKGSRPERQPRVYEAAFIVYEGNFWW